MNFSSWHVRAVARSAAAGGVIAYPTEGVWGFGCDPHNRDALLRLLAIKRRPARMGLILIAADFSQLRPFVAIDALPGEIASTWPGPVTWILPARAGVSPLLRGRHTSVAVRVTDHPPVRALCRAFGGALVSTSANRHHQATPDTLRRLRSSFGAQIDDYLNAPLGGRDRPSQIRNAITGGIVRA